jgi:DNA invertase Pin-like site-specific DNA recombinase
MILGYLRVSTNKQDLTNQELALRQYAEKNKFTVDKFIESEMSSRKTFKERKIDELLEILHEGDTLIVSEISRLGRSVGQIIQIIDTLIKNKINFIALKEDIKINGGEQNMQTKSTITLFSLFAEIERDLISQRTKQGLEVARMNKRLIGRPKGYGKSKLDEKKAEIEALLNNGSTKTFVAKRYETTLQNLYKWLKKNNL